MEVEQSDNRLADKGEETKEKGRSPAAEEDGEAEGNSHDQEEDKTTEDEKRELRSKVLAERRSSVLKSLQGLVTSRGKREVQSEVEVKGCGMVTSHAPLDDSTDSTSQTQEQQEEVKKSGLKLEEDVMDMRRDPALSVTDSVLYRLHGDIRISMTLDNPDVSKCLSALDELSTVSVSSRHIQNHSELIDTLRKMRWFRGSEAIMFKASMLYYRFKNLYLTGDAEDTLSPEHMQALQEEREREEALNSTHTPQLAGMEVDTEEPHTAHSTDVQHNSAHAAGSS
ncbi:uncharacterized protein LOC143486780 [Brachyhypopomus gauderio]|uniref:uncharacterized protein LOC143486780 n=1 Tax=Brachyhypopomus gauderio TaxID=698409 RepID=UPI004041E03C